MKSGPSKKFLISWRRWLEAKPPKLHLSPGIVKKIPKGKPVIMRIGPDV